MAVRQRVRRIDSSVVMGPNSHVTIKRLLLEEADMYRTIAESQYVPDETLSAEANASLEAEFAVQREQKARVFLSEFIVEWDWVDDLGDPLPQPLNNPAVFDKLTDLEFKFIALQFKSDDQLEKKSSKNS